MKISFSILILFCSFFHAKAQSPSISSVEITSYKLIQESGFSLNMGMEIGMKVRLDSFSNNFKIDKQAQLLSLTDEFGKDILAEGMTWEKQNTNQISSNPFNGAVLIKNRLGENRPLILKLYCKGFPTKGATTISGITQLVFKKRKNNIKTSKASFIVSRKDQQFDLTHTGSQVLFRYYGVSQIGDNAKEYNYKIDSEAFIENIRLLDKNQQELFNLVRPEEIKIPNNQEEATLEISYYDVDFFEVPLDFTVTLGF